MRLVDDYPESLEGRVDRTLDWPQPMACRCSSPWSRSLRTRPARLMCWGSSPLSAPAAPGTSGCNRCNRGRFAHEARAVDPKGLCDLGFRAGARI